MKYLICSDIHGDFESAEIIFKKAEEEQVEKIIILGDLLYHGPRNDLPKTYAPKRVIELLNRNKEKILAVRGNCDTEVDQMVLEFPILADYAYLCTDGLTIFATHGHKFNTEALPPLSPNDILLHGHTHVLKSEKIGNKNTYINPGSIALPKEGNPRTYMIYENRSFLCKDINGNVVFETKF